MKDVCTGSENYVRIVKDVSFDTTSVWNNSLGQFLFDGLLWWNDLCLKYPIIIVY